MKATGWTLAAVGILTGLGTILLESRNPHPWTNPVTFVALAAEAAVTAAGVAVISGTRSARSIAAIISGSLGLVAIGLGLWFMSLPSFVPALGLVPILIGAVLVWVAVMLLRRGESSGAS